MPEHLCKNYDGNYDESFKKKVIKYNQKNSVVKKKPPILPVNKKLSDCKVGYTKMGRDGYVWRVEKQKNGRNVWKRGPVIKTHCTLSYLCNPNMSRPLEYNDNPVQKFKVLKGTKSSKYKFVYKPKNSNALKKSFDFTNNPGCKLYKLPCMCYKDGTKTLCTRQSYNSAGLCWQHLKTRWNLTVRQTNISDGGGQRLRMRGLFACDIKKAENEIVFKEGDVICPYIGIVFTEQEFSSIYPKSDDTTAPYMIPILVRTARKRDEDTTLYVDAACLRGIGSLANHDTGKKNAIFVSSELEIPNLEEGILPWLQAVRDIKNGEEIYVSYGKDYQMEMENIETFTRPTGRRGYNNMYNECKIKRNQKKHA